MTLYELLVQRRHLKSVLSKLDLAWVVVCTPLVIEMFFYSRGKYVPVTMFPVLALVWLVIFPLQYIYRGHLIETEKKLALLLKSP